jgi:2-phosphosulfolactate phosphatase
MAGTEWPEVFVHLLPSMIPPGALRGGVAVVVDVLRATTVMVYALHAGIEAIIPCGEIEEARAVAARLPAGTALLAGERQGLPIPGFDLGNSPEDLLKKDRKGKTLVMTTTNGTRAILASLEAEHVGIAAMINSVGSIRWAGSWNLPVHVVCAGTDGLVSLEDTLLAGEIASRLNIFWGYPLGNDEALIADALFRNSIRAERDESIPKPVLIGRGRGGRRVREIGLQKDIEASAREGDEAWNNLVGVLHRDPLRITRWEWAGFH